MGLEYRYLDLEAVEHREDGSTVVRGVAAPYGSPGQVAGFTETIRAGAFGDVGGLDVIMNIQHQRGDAVARTGGGGLELMDGPAGLRFVASIPAYRADVADKVRRRIFRGASIEMRVREDRWPSRDRREVLRADLTGLALVDKPAYEGASLELAAREACREAQAVQWPLAL